MQFSVSEFAGLKNIYMFICKKNSLVPLTSRRGLGVGVKALPECPSKNASFFFYALPKFLRWKAIFGSYSKITFKKLLWIRVVCGLTSTLCGNFGRFYFDCNIALQYTLSMLRKGHSKVACFFRLGIYYYFPKML